MMINLLFKKCTNFVWVTLRIGYLSRTTTRVPWFRGIIFSLFVNCSLRMSTISFTAVIICIPICIRWTKRIWVYEVNFCLRFGQKWSPSQKAQKTQSAALNSATQYAILSKFSGKWSTEVSQLERSVLTLGSTEYRIYQDGQRVTLSFMNVY